MGNRSVRFLQDWIEDNLHTHQVGQSDIKAIALLALRCVDDAAREGIRIQTLYRNCGNLVDQFQQALKEEKAIEARERSPKATGR